MGEGSAGRAPAGGGPLDCFIAYATPDQPVALELYQHLQSQGLRVFLDCESIPAHEIWATYIPARLRESRVAVLLCSEHAHEAHYLGSEIVSLQQRSQRQRSDRKIVVLRLREGVEVPYGLNIYQGADWKGPEQAWVHVRAALEAAGWTPPPPPPGPEEDVQRTGRIVAFLHSEQLCRDLARILGEASPMAPALAQRLVCQAAAETLRQLRELALLPTYRAEGPGRSALRALVEGLLVEALEWQGPVQQARSSGQRSLELEVSLESLAECVMAGVDGRSPLLQRRRDRICGGWFIHWPPAASRVAASPQRSAELLVQRLAPLLADPQQLEQLEQHYSDRLRVLDVHLGAGPAAQVVATAAVAMGQEDKRPREMLENIDFELEDRREHPNLGKREYWSLVLVDELLDEKEAEQSWQAIQQTMADILPNLRLIRVKVDPKAYRLHLSIQKAIGELVLGD